MTWQNPKLNWIATDCFNASDYNRIVGNLLHIKGLMDELFPDFGITTMDANKGYESMFYASDMNAIESNVELFNKYSYELEIGNKKTYKINGNTPAFDEFNRIENASLVLYTRLTEQIADNTAPIITISSTHGDWATTVTYVISGNVQENGNGISETRLYYSENGIDKEKVLTLDSNGDFETQIRLTPGTNKFIVRSRDIDDNPSFEVFYKYCDVTAPKVTITSSTANIVRSTYTLTGRVTDTESGVDGITINNVPVTVAADGTFTKSFSNLVSGANTYTIVATDNVGNISLTNVSITRINDVNNENSNWTKTKATTSGNRTYYQVMSNGSYTNVQLRAYNSGSSWDTASISGSISVYLPKGLRSARIPIGWYGSSSNGTGSVSAKIVDGTTGDILFSGSAASPNSSSTIANLTFTEEQAMHDILLTVKGNAWGREYQGAGASFGLGVTWSGFTRNWTFEYYD